jgi:hypothetical protein
MTGNPNMIHYTQLPRRQPGSELYHEWETYLNEAARLLGEGLEGKFVLIKKEEIIGIYDTEREALTEGDRRYLLTGFLVHQIQTEEKLIHLRWGV